MALFAALIAPYWIDWEQFTDEFELQASRVVGQPVKVGGDSTLRLLPLPFISFDDLEVGQQSNGKPLMRVERFTMKAELLPFLSGDVRIVEMTMLKPRIDLAVEENGTIAWTNPKAPIVNPEQVGIEKLTIESGEVNVTGLAGGREILLDQIHGNLSAKSVLGPWRIQSTGNAQGVPVRLDVSTGTYSEEAKSIRLKIEMDRSDQPYTIVANGPLGLKQDVLSWSGDFSLQPHSSARQAEMIKPQSPLPVFADGLFAATPKTFDIPEYRLEIGAREDPYVVTGTGSVEVGEQVFFRVTADGRQIDLDRIAGSDTSNASADRLPLEVRLATLRSVIERIPVPAGTGEINISLPAIVAGDTFIRDVTTVVRPYNRGWDVRSATATFPGNTKLEASGRVGLFNDYGFAGNMVLASRQPSGFAAWLSGEVSPQIRKLKTVGIASQVSFSPRQTIFEDLELRLDDALIQGRLQRVGADQGKPALIAELRGNRINTEDLRALYSLARGKSDGDLAGNDLNVRIDTDLLETVVGEIPVSAKSVSAKIQVLDGNVSVEKFNSEELFGAMVTSSGRIENLFSKPNGNMKVSIKAENGQGLVDFANRLVGGHTAFSPFLKNPMLSSPSVLSLEIDTSGKEDGASGLVLVDGSVGGSDLTMQLEFDGDLSKPGKLPVTVNVSGTNSNPLTLLQQVGVNTVLPDLAPQLSGPLRFQTSLTGTAIEGLEGRVSGNAPGTNFLATGTLTFPDPSTVVIDTANTLGSADLAPWIRAAGGRLPVPASKNLPVSAKFLLKHTAENTVVNDLKGQAMGTAFNGNLALQREGLSRPRLEGDLSAAALDLALLGELAFGRYGLLDIGGDILPDDELNFGGALGSGLDAKLVFIADKASAGSWLHGKKAKGKLLLLNGEVSVQDFSMMSLGGDLSGSVDLKNADGTVLANLNILLRNGNLREVLDLAEVKTVSNGQVQVTGSFETSGKSVAGLISNLSGNGFANAKNVSVNGFNPASFSQILLQTDAEGFEINSAQVNELAEDVVLDGGFEIAELDVPYSISRGTLKIRNVLHDMDFASVTGETEVDLASRNASARLNLAYVPGKRDEISGADPQLAFEWKGPLGAMERVNDAGLLEGYLSIRAYENSQRRVETLEARVMEKQRHLRQIALGFVREEYTLRKEEEARLLAEEAERLRLEEEARKLAEEEKRLEEERARLEAEKQERERLEAERRLREEAELKAAEEAARIAAEKSKQQEEARRSASSSSQSDASNDIVIEPLTPLDRAGSNSVAPSVRNNIIDSLKDFLQSE